MQYAVSPYTADFVLRINPSTERTLESLSGVAVTNILSGRYAVCYVKNDILSDTIQNGATDAVSAAATVLGTLDRRDLNYAGITAVRSDSLLGLRGSQTIVGMIDTGIDYTAAPFIREDGSTKIISIYDQTAFGPPPAGFYFGHEYTREDINQALSSDDPYSVVPSRDESGHGTFLASVSAGRELDGFSGAAPDAEIVAVKLRRAKPYYLTNYMIPDSAENAFSSVDIMLGAEFILNKARAEGKPCVIFIGLGTNLGSHDGYSIFEEYLSGISSQRGVCLCIAAGNETRARHHAQGQIPADPGTAMLDIKVGTEGSNVYMTLWNEISDRISIAVRSPTGEFVSKVPARPNLTYSSRLALERSTVDISYYFPVEGTGSQQTVLRIHDATEGIWTVTMYGDIILSGNYQAWLPINGFAPPGLEFLASSPYGTVTVPATLPTAICTGAVDAGNGSLYPDSSWGPNRSNFIVPTLIAPGVDVAGFYPYGEGTMSGTSVACAITAGAAALMLEWGIVRKNDISLSTYQIKAYMVRGCRRSEGLTYPNVRTGYGELDLAESFRIMRNV